LRCKQRTGGFEQASARNFIGSAVLRHNLSASLKHWFESCNRYFFLHSRLALIMSLGMKRLAANPGAGGLRSF
jgi:hypothetical protein